MESKTISFKTGKWQELIKTGGVNEIASDTVNYIKAHFDLGEQWSDFERVSAMWNIGEEVKGTQLDEEGNCVVPTDLLDNVGSLEVNLCGTNYENGLVKERLTTFPIKALRITKKAEVGSEATR